MNCRKYSILISHMFTHILACSPGLLPIHILCNWHSPACYKCNNGDYYPSDILFLLLAALAALALCTEVSSKSSSGKVIILLVGLLLWVCFLGCSFCFVFVSPA